MEHLMETAMRIKSPLPALALALALSLRLAGAEELKVERKPLGLGALQEMGQLQKGYYNIGGDPPTTLADRDWIDHFGAFITQQAVVEDRLLLSGGIGGVFQFRKPEVRGSDFNASERKEFFVGPTVAEAVYSFGDLQRPWLKLGAGMFPFKYNPDAANLGEYLFRSGAYPNYIVTGGYVVAGSTASYLEGLKANFDFGRLKADLFLVTETGMPPLYDWSPAIVASYTVGNGFLELGAGVNFKRLISVRPSKTARESKEVNGYFTAGGKDYTTNRNYYDAQLHYDSTYHLNDRAAEINSLNADLAVVDSVLADPNEGGIKYFSSAGIMLMARASLDLKKFLGSGMFRPQDLKLYSEAAVLGVKNYPVFYTDITQRIPVMVGFNVPTFGFLDLFSVQAEWTRSPWLYNTTNVAGSGAAIPFFPTDKDTIASSPAAYNDLAKKDDFKWSVLIQKKIGNFITLSGQVASDHLHLVNTYYYYGPNYDHNDITVTNKDWYWITQISWGI
jgi:hypothetical protein